MRSSTLLVASTLSGLSMALSWSPQPTDAETAKAAAHQGFTPRPTDGPKLKETTLMLAQQKEKRAFIGANVCGFVSGQESSAISCSIGRTCLFYHWPASLSQYGMAGCCTAANTIDCGWAIDCVNSADYSDVCGANCRSDTLTRKCTNALRPYCSTFKYPESGVVDYDCGAELVTGYQQVLLTYDGENVPSNTINVLSDLFSSITPTGPVHSSSSTGPPSPPSITPAASQSSSVPVAAIAGGVVGGLALIGIAAALAVFLCLRSRRKRRQAALAGPPAPPQAGTQYPPGQGPGGYQPVQQQMPPPPMQQQPMSPANGKDAAALAGGYFQPVDQKPAGAAMADPNTTAYQGAAGVPLSKQQMSERPFSAEMDGATPQGTPIPGSPLPVYNQGSYVPPNPTGTSEASQLHGESAASLSPPAAHEAMSHQAGPLSNEPMIHEAPAY